MHGCSATLQEKLRTLSKATAHLDMTGRASGSPCFSKSGRKTESMWLSNFWNWRPYTRFMRKPAAFRKASNAVAVIRAAGK